MSEAKKNSNEVRGAWIGFAGSVGAIVFALVFIIGGSSLFIRYPGTMDDILFMMNWFLLQAVSANIQRAYAMSFAVLFPAGISLIFSLVRRKAGVSFSGILLILIMIICTLGCTLFFSFLTLAQYSANDAFRLSLLVIAGGGVPSEMFLLDPDMFHGIEITIGWSTWYLWFPYLFLITLIAIGGLYMLAARPMPVAKFRRNRMKQLAKADNFERTGKPIQAIKFYERAADLSMKLKEEDKATEYYSKARQIHETAVEAVLKMEEEKKRKELAARRAKLEEERKEILMKADDAEEAEDWERAYHLYREAADRSVDLGQKKLAAQFTAKSKELLRKDKEKKKKEARKKEEEKKRKEDYERKKEEMRKKTEGM
ncbi:MAG: hypothetical protein HWN67_05360 [Candidatus Helarchaeota archaeon]|nr:hypothetical protein [Candidatus Helarchaeota archaeon]